MWNAHQWNKWRQEIILDQMLDQGKITQEEHDEAVAQELVFVAGRQRRRQRPGGLHLVRGDRDLRRDPGPEGETRPVRHRVDLLLSRGGLRIYTCYDPDVQAAVEEVYTNRANLNYTSPGNDMQSAITVIDNSTGDVVAIAGQFGEKKGNLLSNYANSAQRQPGSSIKPLSVYAPALEMGKISPITVLDDYPYQEMNGNPWPYNSGTTRYRGLTDIPNALKVSLNTIAVRILADLVTPQESFNFMETRYHIDLEEGREINGKTYSDIGVSPLAMGGLTDGVTTRDMAEAYATFPNKGTYTYSRTFTRVTHMVDGEEVLLLDNPTVQEQALKDTTAYYMNTCSRGCSPADGHPAALSGMTAPVRRAPPTTCTTGGLWATPPTTPPPCGWAIPRTRRCAPPPTPPPTVEEGDEPGPPGAGQQGLLLCQRPDERSVLSGQRYAGHRILRHGPPGQPGRQRLRLPERRAYRSHAPSTPPTAWCACVWTTPSWTPTATPPACTMRRAPTAPRRASSACACPTMTANPRRAWSDSMYRYACGSHGAATSTPKPCGPRPRPRRPQ